MERIQDSATAKELGAPSQLLGMIHSVTHNIGQEGGTTSVSMNYVREHLTIDDEFLNVFSKTSTRTKKRVRTVLRIAELEDHPELMRLLVASTPQLKIKSPTAVSARSTEVTLVPQVTKTFNPVTE